LSGAEPEMQTSAPRLRERYLPALSDLLPDARGARVERFFITREHAATFRAAPGVGALRPGPRSSVAGLVLAGAWTDAGWPGTLESGVRSGHAAAREALRTLALQPSVAPVRPANLGEPRSAGETRSAAEAATAAEATMARRTSAPE